MKVINFDENEFKEKIIPKYFTSGEQADLYLYIEDGQKKLIKKYRHPLDEKEVSKLKLSYLKSDESKMIIPEKLISIDGKIIGYLSEFKENYTSINNLDLNKKEKYNLLVRMKEILNSMIHAGIYFYDINAGNIMYDGKNIMLCDVPDAYIFGDNNDYSLIPIIHRKFNMFTISYLNNILMNKVEDQVVDILYNWANLKEYEDMIGVTDNDMCINICYEIFHNQKDINFNDLLIDYIDQEKIKQKTI